ncbi:Pentatricopeptide repeat (PPR) superfamily protein [Thalictrum thalictroides]|uniref:Pentatricopeptide repeat (PPR) superfamily protein n=1 Tax=Thalictrum thalictroides TaxID=46969 RepID=A0A7J6VR75_THATH|nr:Pentatricopeptide repeat (PPR) superfamily protein [Thalictrum thalictroides]
MALIMNNSILAQPYVFRISSPSSNQSKFSANYNNNSVFVLLLSKYTSHSVSNLNNLNFKTKAAASSSSSSNRRVENTENNSNLEILDDVLLNRISSLKDAEEVLMLIAEKSERNGGILSTSDCSSIIKAAFDRNNAQLALSVYSAMRSNFNQGVSEAGSVVARWKWATPDVHIYAPLVKGLASSLQVSDAIRIIYDVCQMGVYSGDEVSFGKVVQCPSCMIAVAVAQPQHGSPPAERSMEIPPWERGLRFLNVMKQPIPAAVHSIVVQTPSGTARTHRFATNTVELPAQEGERVTISLAAPANVYREVGPLRFHSKAPGFNPGEAMCLTNHTNGRESLLLRAPVKNGNMSLRNPSFLIPALALLTTTDLASGIIDPSLPRLISISLVASVALGTTLNSVVIPQLNRLPQRMADVLAIKQQLLSQYDVLQTRIKGLRDSAEKEVWMLARMCQLENKIVAVGEPSYRARRSRIQKVRESLESSLIGRIELIDSYARISSMIEIEVEMDSDVLVAESVSNTESTAEQIEQIMELENLEQRWRMQAEANDEVEKLLSSQPIPTEQNSELHFTRSAILNLEKQL